jgi:site-specific DNA-cytosine methylase
MNRNIKPALVGGIGEINFGKQYRQGNRIYSADAIAMALNASPIGNAGGYSYLYTVREGENVDNELRIRKLTPKECFRLMGFDDADCDVLSNNGISNTQLYKMAGNSIVVDVLQGIFSELSNVYELR